MCKVVTATLLFYDDHEECKKSGDGLIAIKRESEEHDHKKAMLVIDEEW
jgi:hypothetical protein